MIIWYKIINLFLLEIICNKLFVFLFKIIIWDTSKPDHILKVLNLHHDMIYSLAINRDGSLIATTSKDKKLRIIEPRTEIIISEGICHQGTKCSKVTFLESGRVLTTGFSKHSDRQYAIWDQHNLNKPLVQEVIDSSSGVITPYFDYDTKMLYLAGKGDGNIRYYEIVDEAPYIYYLNQFLSGQPQKALGFMPKRGVNVAQCEVFRFYKLLAAGCICEPISMIVPRKSTLFQNDIYPDTLSNIPSTTAKEWLSGRNVQPNLMSLQTGLNINSNEDVKLIPVKDKHNGINGSNNRSNDNDINEKKDNNTKKFEFLSQQTIPDYRPQAITDKNQKTTTNTSTKFSQLKAIFGQRNKDITKQDQINDNTITNINIENSNEKTSSLENIAMFASEIEVRILKNLFFNNSCVMLINYVWSKKMQRDIFSTL